MSACGRRTNEEAKYCNVNLVQLRIFHLYHVFGGLEVGGNGFVAKDDVSCSQLFIGMNEDFILEYPRQVGLIYEIKVWGYKVLIYKFAKSENVVRVGNR